MLLTATALLVLLTSLALAKPQSSGDEFVGLGDTGCRVGADCIGNEAVGNACRMASLPIMGESGVEIVEVGNLELRCVGQLGAGVVCGSNLDCRNLNCGCTTEDDGVGVCCGDGAHLDFEKVLSGSAQANSNGGGP